MSLKRSESYNHFSDNCNSHGKDSEDPLSTLNTVEWNQTRKKEIKITPVRFTLNHSKNILVFLLILR